MQEEYATTSFDLHKKGKGEGQQRNLPNYGINPTIL
jgi:hypothetical protein